MLLLEKNLRREGGVQGEGSGLGLFWEIHMDGYDDVV